MDDIPFAEVSAIFPLSEGEEFEALKESIRSNGLREPIWTYRGEIIDGRNRYRACREVGVEPTYWEWDGEGSLVELVLDLNVHRRHLSETQKALIGMRAIKLFEGEALARMKAGKRTDPLVPGREGQDRSLWSSERAAVLAGSSPSSVQRARRVKDNGIPELFAMLEAEEIDLKTAATAAGWPQGKQEDVVARGPLAVWMAAREKAKFEPVRHADLDPVLVAERSAASRAGAAEDDGPDVEDEAPRGDFVDEKWMEMFDKQSVLISSLKYEDFGKRTRSWPAEKRRKWADAIRLWVDELVGLIAFLEGS